MSSMINLKVRLSIAYKNRTGRCFASDFPEVNQYCKTINVPNYRKAYVKKKEKEWKRFKDAIGKGSAFTDSDLESYILHLKNDLLYSQSTCNLTLLAINHGFDIDNPHLRFKDQFPGIHEFLRSLYRDNLDLN